MDYQQEKAQELESLSYIYIDNELEVLDESTLIVRIKTDDDEIVNEEDDWLVEITFRLPEKYPETIPSIEIESNLLNEDQVEELIQKSLSQCQDSLGDAMIFTIASWIKEEAETMIKKGLQEAETFRALELERLELEERARSQGTKVTPDSFSKWQKGFIEEARMSLKRNGGNLEKICPAFRSALAIEDAIQESTKLTGKQLFERDLKLVQSDVQFVEDGEIVNVDTKTLRERPQDEMENVNEVWRNLTDD